jgi:hypothetical protein
LYVPFATGLACSTRRRYVAYMTYEKAAMSTPFATGLA